MTAITAYRRTATAAPSKKRKRTASICSSSSSDSNNLDWDELSEVLWDCMYPHVQRMVVVNAAAAAEEEHNNNSPGSPGSSCGRAFTMPWKAIWEQFIEITGADVGRRSVQARGRTLISKRHKGERRHRWGPEEDDELLRAVDAVEQQCLSRGEPHVTDMDDKEKTVFWDTVYNCTTVRRTKKSMRERHLILEARRSSGQSVHTSGTVGSPFASAVKQEYMMIEPLDLSATSLDINNNFNYSVVSQPVVVKQEAVAVKQEEFQHYGEFGLDPAAYFEIANMMESWTEEEAATTTTNNNNNNNIINNNNNNNEEEESVLNFGLCYNEEIKFDEFIANESSWTQQPLAAGMC